MAGSVLSAKPGPRPLRALIAALWRKLKRNYDSAYQPERHYMRGPGPKCRERDSREAA
jgi:hypothetical protein